MQLCGDAHVKNLGAYASPDGRLVFDINDFDETIKGPWEWDLKRLAASIVLAGREAGGKDCGDAVEDLVRCYRESMASFSTMKTLELAKYEIHGKSENRDRVRSSAKSRTGHARPEPEETHGTGEKRLAAVS